MPGQLGGPRGEGVALSGRGFPDRVEHERLGEGEEHLRLGQGDLGAGVVAERLGAGEGVRLAGRRPERRRRREADLCPTEARPLLVAAPPAPLRCVGGELGCSAGVGGVQP